MKKQIKKIFACSIAAMLSLTIFLNTCSTINAAATSPSENIESDTEISPRKPNIGWRYKAVDGRLYKRLYNYSTEQWIGDWILIP